MSHYSNNVKMCRVDFFRPEGKWYETCDFEFLSWKKEDGLIHDLFQKSLLHAFQRKERPGTYHYSGMTAVCLEPYHEHEHPLMLINWDQS